MERGVIKTELKNLIPKIKSQIKQWSGKLSNQTIDQIFEVINELVAAQERIAELKRHIRDIEKPQFRMFKNGECNPASYCCNHCEFSSPKFAKREEHIKSCVEREKYLGGQ
jgi:hypothetical protein